LITNIIKTQNEFEKQKATLSPIILERERSIIELSEMNAEGQISSYYQYLNMAVPQVFLHPFI
jgi:hypothetical protein